MNFTFTQDQLDFQEAIASMLKSEVTAAPFVRVGQPRRV